MLPTAFHDVTRLREISIETWHSILTAAEENGRIGAASSHEALWQSLTTGQLSAALFEALEVLDVLGSDAGRDLLLNAADDRQVQLGAVEDESAGELAARIWVQSRTNTPLAEVLMLARLGAYEASHHRPYREFIGERAVSGVNFDREKIKEAVSRWCRDNGKSEAIEVYITKNAGEWRCEVLRGEAAKRVVEIKNRQPEILSYRPGVADHLRYDPETGRLGIATRSPRLLGLYREVVGSILSGNHKFFSNENICTLKPLQQQGRGLFDRLRVPGIVRVDVVELRWRRGERDKVWIAGPDCFRILHDLQARVEVEGELMQAKLLVYFSGIGRRGQVTITVPGRIEINAGAREHLVERLLDQVGLRGSFGQDNERLDLWSLHPWRLREDLWRKHLGAGTFDQLLRERAFKSVRLEAVPHPDHPGQEGALTTEDLDGRATVGVSDDPTIPIRTLTPSDVMGYELDISWVAGAIAGALILDGTTREITNGILFLGQRTLAPGVFVAVFLATRQLPDTAGHSVKAACNGARPVLLVPTGRAAKGDVMQLECRLPQGPYDGLLGQIVEILNLQDQVPPASYRPEELIIDPGKGEAWYHGTLLTKLQEGTHPFKFAEKVAGAGGQIVTKEALREHMSPANPDDGVVRKAKADFVKKVEDSFAEAGRECPPTVKDVFKSTPGGYVLKATAYLVP
jgi:hypothetical protein